MIGATDMQRQQHELRQFPTVVIATPGRLIDHLTNSMSMDLESVEVLIFDEADKLLELGFSAEIKQIVKLTNSDRQTLLFSATLNSGVDELIALALRKPIRIQANPDSMIAERLRQEMSKLPSSDEQGPRGQSAGSAAEPLQKQDDCVLQDQKAVPQAGHHSGADGTQRVRAARELVAELAGESL